MTTTSTSTSSQMGGAESKQLRKDYKTAYDDPSKWPDLVKSFTDAVPSRKSWTKDFKDKLACEVVLRCVNYEHEKKSGDLLRLVMALQRLPFNATMYTAFVDGDDTWTRIIPLIDPEFAYTDQCRVKVLQAIKDILAPEMPEFKALKLETKARGDFVKNGGTKVICKLLSTILLNTSTMQVIMERQQLLVAIFDILITIFGNERYSLSFSVIRLVINDLLTIPDCLYTAACSQDDTVAYSSFMVIAGLMSEVTYEELAPLQEAARQSGCLLAAMARSIRSVDSPLRNAARFALLFLVDGSEVNLRIVRKLLPPALSAYLSINAVGYTGQLQREVAEFTPAMLPVPLTDQDMKIRPFDPASRPKRKERLEKAESSQYSRQVIGTRMQRSNWKLLWTRYDMNCCHPLHIWNDDIRSGLEQALLAELHNFRSSLRECTAEQVPAWDDFALRIVPKVLEKEHKVGSYYLTPLCQMLKSRYDGLVSKNLLSAVLGCGGENTTSDVQSAREPMSPRPQGSEEECELRADNGAILGHIRDSVYIPTIQDIDLAAVERARAVRKSLNIGFDIDQPSLLFRDLSDLLVATVLKGKSIDHENTPEEALVVTLIDTMIHLLRVQPLDVMRSLPGMTTFLAALIHPDCCNQRWSMYLFSLLSLILEPAPEDAPYSFKQSRGDTVASFVQAGGVDSLSAYVTDFVGKEVPTLPVQYDKDGFMMPIDYSLPEWQQTPAKSRNAYQALYLMNIVLRDHRRLAAIVASPLSTTPYYLAQGLLVDSPVIAGQCALALASLAEATPTMAEYSTKTGVFEFSLYRLCHRPIRDSTWNDYNRGVARALYFLQSGGIETKPGNPVRPDECQSQYSVLRHFLPAPMIGYLVGSRGSIEWAKIFGSDQTAYNAIWNSSCQERLSQYITPHIESYVQQVLQAPTLSWAAYRYCVVNQVSVSSYTWTPESDFTGLFPMTTVDYPQLSGHICVGDIYVDQFIRLTDDEAAKIPQLPFVIEELMYALKWADPDLAALIHDRPRPESVLQSNEIETTLRAMSKIARADFSGLIAILSDDSNSGNVTGNNGLTISWRALASGITSDYPDVVMASADCLYDMMVTKTGQIRKECMELALSSQTISDLGMYLVRWCHPSIYPSVIPQSGPVCAAIARTLRPLISDSLSVQNQPGIVLSVVATLHCLVSCAQQPVCAATVATAWQSLHAFIVAQPQYRNFVYSLGTSVYAITAAFFPDFMYAECAISGEDPNDRTEMDEMATMTLYERESVKRQGGFSRSESGAAPRVPMSVQRYATKFLHEASTGIDLLSNWVAQVVPPGTTAMFRVPGAFAQMLRPNGTQSSENITRDIFGPRCIILSANQYELWAFLETKLQEVQTNELAGQEWRDNVLNRVWIDPSTVPFDVASILADNSVTYTSSDTGDLLGGVHIQSLLASPDSLILDEDENEHNRFFTELSSRITQILTCHQIGDETYTLADLCLSLRVVCRFYPDVCETGYNLKVIDNIIDIIKQTPFTNDTIQMLAYAYDAAGSMAGLPFTAQYIARNLILPANLFMATVAYMPPQPFTNSSCASLMYFLRRLTEIGVYGVLLPQDHEIYISRTERMQRAKLMASGVETEPEQPPYSTVVVGKRLAHDDDKLTHGQEAKNLAYVFTDYAVLAHILRLILGGFLELSATTDGLMAISFIMHYFDQTKPHVATELCEFVTAVTDNIFSDVLLGKESSIVQQTFAGQNYSTPEEAAALIAPILIGNHESIYSVWKQDYCGDIVAQLDRVLGNNQVRTRLMNDTRESAWSIVSSTKRRHAEQAFQWQSVTGNFHPLWKTSEPRCQNIYVRIYTAMPTTELAKVDIDGVAFFTECVASLRKHISDLIEAAADEEDSLFAKSESAGVAICYLCTAMERICDSDSNVSAATKDAIPSLFEQIYPLMDAQLGVRSLLEEATEPCQLTPDAIHNARCTADIIAITIRHLIVLATYAAHHNDFAEHIRSTGRVIPFLRVYWMFGAGEFIPSIVGDIAVLLATILEGAPLLSKVYYQYGVLLRALLTATSTRLPLGCSYANARILFHMQKHYRPAAQVLQGLCSAQITPALNSNTPDLLQYMLRNPKGSSTPEEWSGMRLKLTVSAYTAKESDSVQAYFSKLTSDKVTDSRKRIWSLDSVARSINMAGFDDSRENAFGVTTRQGIPEFILAQSITEVAQSVMGEAETAFNTPIDQIELVPAIIPQVISPVVQKSAVDEFHDAAGDDEDDEPPNYDMPTLPPVPSAALHPGDSAAINAAGNAEY